MANKQNKMVLGYVGKLDEVTEADAKILTHINLAFGIVTQEYDITVSERVIPSIETVRQIRAWNPDIKFVLSLVSRHPDTWSDGAASEEYRAKIAASCAKVCLDYELDGVDFDWEYPCVQSNNIKSSPDDKHNFTLMLKAVREALDAIPGDKHYLNTIAAGADVYYCENVEMDQIMKYLDYINVMTYDLKCGFHAISGHHTNLYASVGDYFHNSCDRAMRIFHSYGVPKDQLVMGCGFYSRKWENVQNVNNGLLQWTKTGGGYGPAYHDILENYLNKNGFTAYWDDVAKAPWLYNPETGIFISYDDPRSLEAKCDYIVENEYAGIFYWVHSSDNTKILLNSIQDAFNK